MFSVLTDIWGKDAHVVMPVKRIVLLKSQKRFVIAVCLLLSLTACGRNRTEPAPVPTASTSEITAPEPTPIGEAVQTFQSAESGSKKLGLLGSDRAETQVTSARYGYTLTLPSGWWILDLPKHGEETLVSAIAQQTMEPLLIEAAQHFVNREDGVRTEIIARNHKDKDSDGDPSVAMTLLIIPRHGLSLEQYLAGTVGEMAEADAALEIEEYGVDGELRTDGVPIATLQYTHTDPPAGAITYYHAVLIDSTADYLLAITFAAPATHFASERSAMQGIIADMTLR